MSEQYLCKDCKHKFLDKKDWILKPFFWFGAYDVVRYQLKCRRSFVEQKVEQNPVTGDKIKEAHYLSCDLSRSKYYGEDFCGESAKFWEPEDPKKLFVWIKKESQS
jgi:hypothetical protein